MDQAVKALRNKDYCTALNIFHSAFSDSNKTGTYDLFYAAVAAARCKHDDEALTLLQKSRQKGLGLNPGEITYIEKDSSFLYLHDQVEWKQLIDAMNQALAAKEANDKKRAADWKHSIQSNAIKGKTNGQYQKASKGFALYFTTADTLQVPYLVYVPDAYDPGKPMPAIVYLHGGVAQTEQFYHLDPDAASGEPIFVTGDSLHALVIYPFGKKDFGWVHQQKAFENVLTIIQQAEKNYHIDTRHIYLGGMSNGGTATFWFATYHPELFKGFYTFSANPQLETGTIHFNNLGKDKPFISVQAKDDDVFPYDSIYAIYKKHADEAGNWHFETISSGGHGFIYMPGGQEKVIAVLRKLMSLK